MKYAIRIASNNDNKETYEAKREGRDFLAKRMKKMHLKRHADEQR